MSPPPASPTVIRYNRPGLLHRARQPIKDVAPDVVLGCLQRPADHVQHDPVRDQLALVQEPLDLLPKVGLASDMGAQQVTGRDVRDTKVLGDQPALGALTRTRSGQHQHTHEQLLPSGRRSVDPPTLRSATGAPQDPASAQVSTLPKHNERATCLRSRRGCHGSRAGALVSAGELAGFGCSRPCPLPGWIAQ